MTANRWRILHLCSVAGVGAIAGCSTSSPDRNTRSGEPQQSKIADDGGGGDNFGDSVAMSSDGTTALVGAWSDANPNGELAGSAYVFNL